MSKQLDSNEPAYSLLETVFKYVHSTRKLLCSISLIALLQTFTFTSSIQTDVHTSFLRIIYSRVWPINLAMVCLAQDLKWPRFQVNKRKFIHSPCTYTKESSWPDLVWTYYQILYLSMYPSLKRRYSNWDTFPLSYLSLIASFLGCNHTRDVTKNLVVKQHQNASASP